jgi:hypothetical protein
MVLKLLKKNGFKVSKKGKIDVNPYSVTISIILHY